MGFAWVNHNFYLVNGFEAASAYSHSVVRNWLYGGRACGPGRSKAPAPT